MNWRDRQFRFSIRKLKVAVASTVVGITSAGLLGHVTLGQGSNLTPLQPLTVQADETNNKDQEVSIDYHYVNYEDLTDEQKTLLRDSKDFPKEVAKESTHYLLVYRKDKGLVALPETGDQAELYSLLSGLGILAVLVAATAKDKKRALKVFVVTAVSGAALTAANSQALETGLRSFLNETHLVKAGEALPQPQERIGERLFTYYIPQETASSKTSSTEDERDKGVVPDQASTPEKPVTPTTPETPVVPEKPTTPETPVVPETPAKTDKPVVPETPVETDKPVVPEKPTETDDIGVTETPTDTNKPEVPEKPAETDGIGVTETPTDTNKPEVPEKPTETDGTEATETPTDTDKPVVPEKPAETDGTGVTETPTDTDKPVVPEKPTETDGTGVTEAPTDTDKPEVPEKPAETDGTGVTETPTDTDKPVVPEKPTETEGTGVTETPTDTDKPVVPEKPTETDGTGVTEAPTDTDKPVVPEKPTETDGTGVTETPTDTDKPVVPEKPTETDGTGVTETPTTPEKPAGPKEEIITETIAFSRITTNDPNLWEGETVIDTPGQNGSATYRVRDGVRQLLSQTPATPQIERVGTKPVEGTISITEEIVIPTTEVDYVDKDQLPEGEVEFISPAIYGKKTITTVYKTIKGERTDEVIGQPVETIVTKPVNAKIGLGTKKAEPEQPKPVAVDKNGLAQVLTEAAFKNESDYTADSWQNFQAKKNQAQASFDNQTATQAEIDAAIRNLRDAINGLTPKPIEQPKPAAVDKTALAQALAEAAEKTPADYTSDSWQALINQGIAAQQTFNNPQATQEQVNAATTNLRAAINSLTPKPIEQPKPVAVDKNELAAVLTEAAFKNESDYTADSWQNFQAKKNQAQASFDNQTATQAEIDAAIRNLRDAINGLTPKPIEKPKPATVDKNELAAVLTEAAFKNESDYTADSWQNFQVRKNQAQASFDNQTTTQAEVDAAIRNLRDAIKGLTPKPIEQPKPVAVDKTALAQVLAEAAEKTPADYTSDSWQALVNQGIAAQQTFNNPQASQEQVNAATTNLRAAINGLTPKPIEQPKPAAVDKAALAQALTEAAEKKPADYTADSWQNLVNQGIAAQQTFNNPQATQEQVNAATTNLRAAINGLTPKPIEQPKPATVDKAALAQALAEAAEKKPADYTSDSWQNLVNQGIAAQQTFNNPQATQEQVNTATTNLRAAINGLVLKQADRPVLAMTSLTTDDLDKTATISYQLTDPSQTFTGATVSIYQGDQKISELRLTKEDLLNKQLTFANYDTDYQIRTAFTYTKDGGQETAQLPSRDVRFTFKKLEIKDIDNITLHRYVNGNLTTVDHFQGKSPEAASQYFVRINSSRYRDLLLPVGSFEETTHNGQAAYRVKTNVDQLVEGSAQDGFQDQFDFLVGKTRPLTISDQHRTSYTSLPGAQASRATAYENTEKLLPFYNKETLVSYGNLIDPSSKLHTTKLLSVTPMVNNQIIADVIRFKTELNRLMLHYEDETIDYLPLAYKSDFRNTAVSEYSIGNTGLIYTPEQFLSNHDRIVEAVLPTLQGVTYKSEDMRNALNIDLKGGTVSDAMDKLYLEPTFDAIKADLPNQLRQLLATDKAIMANNGVVQDYVIDYIKANKERLLMGLAYMNRWYNVNFDQTNIKNLASFHQDFFGKPVNTLEFLVNLTEGKEGYDLIKPSRNVSTYKEKIAPLTGKAELTDYLTANRKLFTRFADDNTWFKATSKAYVVEAPSKELPNQDVRVYSMLTTEAERNGILPLLTAKEDELFIMTTMGSITYGMYDRYLNSNQPKAQQLAKIKEMVNLTAKRQAAYFDAWYRIAPEHSRDNMIKAMPVWDGYFVQNNSKWLPLFGKESNQAIKDFFGPIGDRADVANIGAGAWADGSRIAYNYDKILEDYGTSVFTHEATHNNDGTVYLGGYGRREGMGAEAYALGLLQSGSLLGHAEDALTLNLIFDYKDKENATDRMTNVSPDRFQNADDIKTYVNGVFDVLYTLDYAEAEAVLKQGTGLTKDWFGVLENYDGKTDSGRILPHAGNSIRSLTDSEASSLRTWQDLIDKNLIGLRGYSTRNKEKPNEKNVLDRNGYFQSYLFTPHFAALSNDKGAPGDLMFRRMAFELLAEKGYEDGFLPYTSGYLGEVAERQGSVIYSDWYGRNVPLITDKHVFDHVLKGDYTSWSAFKKAMFQRRIDRAGQLKPIEINYLGQNIKLTSFAQLQDLMDAAVRYDADHKIHNTPLYSYTIDTQQAYDVAYGSHVNNLKAAIYNAYLRQSQDFKDSIYNPVDTNPTPAKPVEDTLPPAASLNLISNPSLEAHDYTSNKPTPIIHRSGNRADYTKTVDGNKVYKSKDNSANDFFFYEVTTVPGRTYTVSADIRLDVANGHQADGAFFAVKVVEPSGQQRTLPGGKGVGQMTDSVGKWAKQTLTFTADSTKTHIGLVKWHDNQGHANTLNTSILMDNLKVAEDTVYHERWKDTFVGDKLDDQRWSYELGNVRGNEQQHYSSSKENVDVANGILKITATDRPETDQYRNTQRNGDNARLVTYNSGSVQTIGRQEFLYGRIEARMKLPKGQAVFPAFWTLGADFNIANRITHGQGYGWPATGEIDIMELVGVTNGLGNQTVYGTPHFYYPAINDDGNIGAGYYGTLTVNKDFADDYHVFGINWSEDRIEWYVDDVVYNTLVYDNSERSQALKAGFNRPQYIQFNLAMGGNWPGDAGTNLAGQALEVDWVRWLQTDKQKADMERYYADKPKLSGVKHVTIVQGEVPNLLNEVTIDRNDYRLEVSIDNEFQFVNTGAPGGRNEPKNVVASASKLGDIANLEPGVYNIFYTTIPTASDFSPRSIPVYKMTRDWSHLIILPRYYGAQAGTQLSSLTLPEGWRWANPSQTISADGEYEVIITNTKDPIAPENRREYTVKVSGQALMKTGRN